MEFGCGKSIIIVLMYDSVSTVSTRMCARVRPSSVSIWQCEEMTVGWHDSGKAVKEPDLLGGGSRNGTKVKDLCQVAWGAGGTFVALLFNTMVFEKSLEASRGAW